MSQKYYLPVLAIMATILSGCNDPDSSSSSSTAIADTRRAQIEKDCGTSKEETEAWFGAHKTGWAEHIEAGLKCIHEHQ
jgi:hypothetical protein